MYRVAQFQLTHYDGFLPMPFVDFFLRDLSWFQTSITTIPSIASISIMSDLWVGEDPNDMSAAALGAVGKRLLAEKFPEVGAAGEIIRATQGPSRHANTKSDGCVLIVSLISTAASRRTELIQITSELFISRTAMGHLAIATF